jgi:hypothetical protein
LRVLGVDLASRRWRDVGVAALTLSDSRDSVSAVDVPAIEWPQGTPLTPRALAEAIDEYSLANEISAVSIDGPQGWRNPAAPEAQGVGRACERSARTPGKTGVRGTTYPANQVGWISFSIELFDCLLERDYVSLASDPAIGGLEVPELDHYYVLECFPTVTWRSSGLTSLPAKSKGPNTMSFAQQLRGRWPLPELPSAIGHDDLQAIVAALVAASLFGFGTAIPHGTAAIELPGDPGSSGYRAEGVIWDAAPAAMLSGVDDGGDAPDHLDVPGGIDLVPIDVPLIAETLESLDMTPQGAGQWVSADGTIRAVLHSSGILIGWVDVAWSHPAGPPVEYLRDTQQVLAMASRTERELTAAIAKVAARRTAAIRTCRYCLQVFVPGDMHDERTCQGCAARHLGVVY